MKRIIVFALVLNAALLGVIAHQLVAIAGGGAVSTADQNGDVNGDARLDMSDAIYLLLHIFRNGPEPVAMADSPEVIERLDDLEQAVADLAVNPDETVFQAIRLAGTAELRCPDGQPLSCNRNRGPLIENSYTRTLENQSYLSKCSVTEEHLVFTTDRNSDLLFSFRRYGGSNSVFSIYLDEVYISGFGIGGSPPNGFGAAYSFVVPNVPVGNHRMSWVTELRGLGPQSLDPGQVFVSQATFDVKATYISSN